MNEGKEIRFIDLFSGIGGFRLGLERANEERRFFRRQDMHGCRTDADECLEHRREASGGHISQESPRDSEIGLERANKISEHPELWVGDKEGRFEQHAKSGGLGEGHPSLGYRCVWSCDNNRYANKVYTKQFGEANHYSGNIRGVDPRDIPDFDLLCA
ncbi:unnamed protein product, partial [marine sediment metagenome]